MKVKVRQFYKSLSSDEKKKLAHRLGVSYQHLSNGYFNVDPTKRPDLSTEKMTFMLSVLNTEFDSGFRYVDLVEHFYMDKVDEVE